MTSSPLPTDARVPSPELLLLFLREGLRPELNDRTLQAGFTFCWVFAAFATRFSYLEHFYVYVFFFPRPVGDPSPYAEEARC